MEFLGREFRTVTKGLDPNEVVEFLRDVSESSEDIFQRLEQFSALQSAAKTIEESISQAKRLAEYAKKQAELEARQKRAQAAEEAGRQAMVMLDRVKESCLSSVDGTHDILLAAVRESLEDAKETISSNLAQIGESIEKAAKERLSKWQADVTTSAEHPLSSQAETNKIVLSGKRQEDIELEKAVPNLINLHESSTESSESDSSTVETPEVDFTTNEVTGTGDSPESEEDRVTDITDSVSTNLVEATGLYNGSVTVIIPRGVQDTWMQQFRKHLSKTDGVKIKGETERDKERIEVELSLDKPIELLPLLQDLPNVRKVMEYWDTGKSPDGQDSGHVNRASKKSDEVALILQFA